MVPAAKNATTELSNTLSGPWRGRTTTLMLKLSLSSRRVSGRTPSALTRARKAGKVVSTL
eukprot:5924979-Heterocapsa_arctica.AAC.1